MKRRLTEEEIEYILDFIKPQTAVPPDTAMSVVNINKMNLRRQLETQMIYPDILDKLKSSIEEMYKNSLIQPGESVGILCAQSIGEKQTQTTLNTFHKCGMSEKTMTSGVPRFQELINATRKPRIVNHRIHFKKKHDTAQDLRDTVGNRIVGMTLKDIATSISVVINKKEEPWYKSYAILYDDKFMAFEHCISIKLNMNKIFEFKIMLHEITDFIHNEFDDLHCVFSPPHAAQLDIFVDCSNIELPEERILFIDSSNAIEIYLEECVQPVLEKLNFCGIPGITEVFYTREADEWLVETNGINSRSINTRFINFKDLLALDIIDNRRTTSNNVWDIFDVLGIEAARQFLIEEFMSILEGINPCHPCLLVDRMTHTGGISSITRYTMKKDDSGPFGKASFEETMDNFLNAAARGEVEPTKGVSASIICGKRASVGTGMINLRIDMEKLPKVAITDRLGHPIRTRITPSPIISMVRDEKKEETQEETYGIIPQVSEPLMIQI